MKRHPAPATHHRNGLQLARLNRRVKARNRREIGEALLFLAAIVLALAVWIGVCMVVS